MKHLSFALVTVLISACSQHDSTSAAPELVQSQVPAVAASALAVSVQAVAITAPTRPVKGVSDSDRAALRVDFSMFSMSCHGFFARVGLKRMGERSMRKVSWADLGTSGDNEVAAYAPSYRAQLQELAFAPAVVEKLKQVRAVEQRCGSAVVNSVRFHGLDPDVGAAQFDRDFAAAQDALNAELDALPVLPNDQSLGITTRVGLDTKTD